MQNLSVNHSTIASNSSNVLHNMPSRTSVILSIAFGSVGAVAVILNIIVILFIIRRGLKSGPNADILLFSLAFADLIFAFQALLYSLFFNQIIVPNTIIEEVNALLFISFSSGMAIISSLFHMVAITTDRFIVVSYPLRHRTLVTRRRIFIAVAVIWVVSAIVSSSQFWMVLPKAWRLSIIDWVQVFGNMIGSCCFLLTYIYICSITLHRRKILRRLSVQQRRAMNSKAQTQTTVLSILIVVAFMLCNLPHSITKFILTFHVSWPSELSFSIALMLTLNTLLDPILYSIVGIFTRKTREVRRESTSTELLRMSSHRQPKMSREKRAASVKRVTDVNARYKCEKELIVTRYEE